MKCGQPLASTTPIHDAEVYAHFFNATPYDSMDVGGWRVIALDSKHGATFNPNNTATCNTQ